jgi:putative endonuclease
LFNRVAHHNEGGGASYTKTRRPIKLVYYEEFPDQSKAVKREREIKKLNKEQKKKTSRRNQKVTLHLIRLGEGWKGKRLK